MVSLALSPSKSLWSYNPIPYGCVLYVPLWAHKLSGNLPTLLVNGGFEAGDPPDSWTLAGAGAAVAQDGTTKKVGSYSAKLTRSGANADIHQGNANYAAYAGKTVTVGGWVYATVANRAILQIHDGVGNTFSSYHSGVAGWEWLTASQVIDGTPSQLRAYCYVLTGDTDAFFDGLIMADTTGGTLQEEPVGTTTFKSTDPFGHTCTNYGANSRAKGGLFDGGDDYIAVPAHTILNIRDAITVAISLKENTQGTNDNPFNKGGVIRLYENPSDEMRWKINADSDVNVNSSVTLSTGTPYTIIGTYDKDAGGDNQIIYVNNTATADANTGQIDATAADDIIIGALDAALAAPYDGLIGEMGVWNRAFSAAEATYFTNQLKGRRP